MPREYDMTFESMGSDVRLLVGAAVGAGLPSADAAIARERAFVEQFAARLTRFDPSSELCALNSDAAARCPLRGSCAPPSRPACGRRSASGGLVDPTLVGPLERAGYASSRAGGTPVSLAEALANAPARRPAAPDPAAAWRSIVVDDRAGWCVGRRACASTRVVTARGWPRTRSPTGSPATRAWSSTAAATSRCAANGEVEVEHPLTGERVHTLQLNGGGVATSGLNVRALAPADGSYAHHLLDPSTGEPAWTGLIGATAHRRRPPWRRRRCRRSPCCRVPRARAPRSPSTAGSSSTTTATWS